MNLADLGEVWVAERDPHPAAAQPPSPQVGGFSCCGPSAIPHPSSQRTSPHEPCRSRRGLGSRKRPPPGCCAATLPSSGRVFVLRPLRYPSSLVAKDLAP